MDVVERLTLDAAQADTMLAAEHRHRYEFAAELCRGLRVLDLCCGSGYGTAILAGDAREVLGVDVDLATVETARATIGAVVPNVAFEAADALGYLRAAALREFDAVVCFEGLEHLSELEAVVKILREHAASGLRIVASVPNDKLFEDTNPYHVTQFGYDEARRLFGNFEQVTLVPQFLAEGSLILPAQAQETDVRVTLGDRHESEYANHFIFCIGFPAGEVGRAHHGRVQLNVSPVFNRWSEDLKRGASALRRENARLARARLGKAGAAAGALLARLQASEAQTAALKERCRLADERVEVLKNTSGGALGEGVAAGHLSENGGPSYEPGALPSWGRPSVVDAAPLSRAPEEDPNSWQQRRRRAAEVLIPWIEQTVPLGGRTVLEYGCGNGAVSSAFAERAKRVIGLDIDEAAVALGRRELAARHIANAELQHHSRGDILDAVGELAGGVDVFLLYAVLEHLTVQERLAVLHLAREVVAPDGAIVVCETPNRLTFFDHHTAQMPFFHLLPDDLAARYYDRSARTDFTSALAAAAGEAALLEAVARWGRGVSFHEFELVFEDLGRHVVASSYDPLLLGERPVHPEEVTLARYLDRTMPGLAPAFSRQWLDLILSPRPIEHRGPRFRPWTADTTQSTSVSWTAWDNLLLQGPGSALTVDLPHPTQRLLVGTVSQDAETLALRVHTAGEPLPLTVGLRVPPPGTAFASFAFTRPVGQIVISASSRCHIVFVGYEE